MRGLQGKLTVITGGGRGIGFSIAKKFAEEKARIVIADIRIEQAEQAFENGRMFYLQPNQEIWVMINTDDDTAGVWTRHRDTWSEDLPETDPSIVPPEEDLYQPIRGFGKLWRENPAVREALGWALEDEMGHVTDYAYYAGGEVTADGEYVPGPGYHTIRSRFGQTYIFDETNGTWRQEEPANGE